MNKFIIIEVGSTNTKTYLYEDTLKDLGIINIPFKSNYKLNKRIMESDLEKLYEHIASLKQYNYPIYVFGTSVFRELDNLERGNFLKEFKDKTKLDFTIVTQEMENELIVHGVISELDYNGRIAVMIGGIEEIELSIIEDKKTIEKINNNYGANDICNRFTDINDETATSLLTEMISDTLDIIKTPENKADILVLAGGDYLKFYETLKYPLKVNKFYYDKKQPWYIDNLTMDEYNEDFFYHKSLVEVQNENFESRNWWNGQTRGMQICIAAIAKNVNAKYIIPTKITMIFGIIEKIKNN
jgi:hypothetical protein